VVSTLEVLAEDREKSEAALFSAVASCKMSDALD
jgi:hypothetical protein